MSTQQATRRPSLKCFWLSQSQLRRILELSTEDPTLRDLHDVAVFISNTGIRLRGLRELLWTDIDLQGRKLVVADLKNACMRSVPFGPKTLQMLQSRREHHPDAEYVLGESPLGLLRRVSRQLRTVCEGIGVRGVTLRVLRHTFFLRLAGWNVESCRTFDGNKLPSVWRSFLTEDQRFKMAARDQARIEEL